MRITNRDVDVLTAVGDYQMLTTLQIRHLLFPSLHRTRKRLTILHKQGLLRRFRQPVQIGLGSSQFIYLLPTKGFRILESYHSSKGLLTTIKPTNRVPSPLFLEHTLQRNDFRIDLTRSCAQNPEMALSFWRQGPSIGHVVNVVSNNTQNGWKRTKIIADGYFCVKLKNISYSFFVEIDRGTMSHRRLQEKAHAYAQLLRQYNDSQNETVLPFRLLIVTNSKSRLQRFIQHINKTDWSLPSQFLKGTTFDSVVIAGDNLIMNRIWETNMSRYNRRQSMVE